MSNGQGSPSPSADNGAAVASAVYGSLSPPRAPQVGRLTRARFPGELGELDAAGRAPTDVVDQDVFEGDAVNVQPRKVGGLAGRRLRGARAEDPVATSVVRAHEPDGDIPTVQLAHPHLAAEKREELHAQPELADASELGRVKPGGFAMRMSPTRMSGRNDRVSRAGPSSRTSRPRARESAAATGSRQRCASIPRPINATAARARTQSATSAARSFREKRSDKSRGQGAAAAARFYSACRQSPSGSGGAPPRCARRPRSRAARSFRLRLERGSTSAPSGCDHSRGCRAAPKVAFMLHCNARQSFAVSAFKGFAQPEIP